MNTLQTLQSTTTASCSLEEKKQSIVWLPKKVLLKLDFVQNKNLEQKNPPAFRGGLLTREWLENNFSPAEIEQLYTQLQRYDFIKFLAGTPWFQTIFFINNFHEQLPKDVLLWLLQNLRSASRCIQFILETRQDVFDALNNQLQSYKKGRFNNELQSTLQEPCTSGPSHYLAMEKIHEKLGLDFIGKLRNQTFVSGLPDDTKLTRNRFTMNPEYAKGNITSINTQIPLLKQSLEQYISFINSQITKPSVQQRLMVENDMDPSKLSPFALQQYFQPIGYGESFRVDMGISEQGKPIIYEIDDFPRGNIHYIAHDLAQKGKSSMLDFIRQKAGWKTVLVLMRNRISPTNQYDHEQLNKVLNQQGIKSIVLFEKDAGQLIYGNNLIKYGNQDIGLVIQAWDLTPGYFELMAKLKSTGVPMTPTYSSLSSKSRYSILSESSNPLNASWVFAPTISCKPNQTAYTDFSWNRFGTIAALLYHNKDQLIVKYTAQDNAEWVIVLPTLSQGQLQASIAKVQQDLQNGNQSVTIQQFQHHVWFQDVVYNSKTKQVGPFKGKILSRLYMVYEKNGIKIAWGEHMLTTGSKLHGMVDMAIYPLSDTILW